MLYDELPFASPLELRASASPATRPARPIGSSSAATSCSSRWARSRCRATTCGCKARPAWARLPLQKNHNWLGVQRGPDAISRARWAACSAGPPSCRRTPSRPPACRGQGLRTLFSVLDDAHFALAGRALQLVDWDRTHQFCGRCGTRTEAKREERVRVCPACKLYGLSASGARGHGARQSRGKRAPARAQPALSARHVQRARRLRRARRVARAVPRARSARGSRRARRATSATSRASRGRSRIR